MFLQCRGHYLLCRIIKYFIKYNNIVILYRDNLSDFHALSHFSSVYWREQMLKIYFFKLHYKSIFCLVYPICSII